MSWYSWFRYKKLRHNGKLYLILKKIHSDKRPIIPNWKEHLNCDLVLRGSDNYFYFLEEVMDVEYEEI